MQFGIEFVIILIINAKLLKKKSSKHNKMEVIP